MADWGLYAALRGTDNWAQRRADKQMNMQIQEKQAAREAQKTQQSMLAEEQIQTYIDEMAAIDVLPEDQAKITELEKNSRANIVQGIARYNGDLSRYISSGGITDLHNYKNSIIQSKEVKTALSNKENMAKIIADKQAGNRWFKPIQITTMVQDENGNDVEQTKTYDIDQQIAAFKNGEIDRIQYNGSEKRQQINAMTFKQFAKNPRKPYSKDNRVSASDVMFQAMEGGASEDYAYALAESYAKRVKANPNAVWYWGGKSAEEQALAHAKIGGVKAAAAAKTKEEVPLPDYYTIARTGKGARSSVKKGTFDEFETKDGKVGAGYRRHNVDNDQRTAFLDAMGITQERINNSKASIFEDGEYVDAAEAMKKNPLGVPNGEIISPRSGKPYSFYGQNYTLTNLGNTVYNIDGKSYLEGEIYTDENALDSDGGNGIIDEYGVDHVVGDWKGENLIRPVNAGMMSGWSGSGLPLSPNPDYLLKVFVPIPDNPWASKHQTEKLVSTQYKEQMGVEDVNRGRTELDLGKIGMSLE